MSHITKEEHLSAFLDGEAGSFEQQRMCSQLESDELMKDKLANFALIGEAVRNQAQSRQMLANDSFLKGIQDAISDDVLQEHTAVDESTVIIPGKVAKRRIIPKQVMGYAMAASLAAVAAISVQNYFSGEPAEMVASAPESSKPVSVNTALMTASIAVKPVAKSASESFNYRLPDPETRGMMNKYIAHHLQYASATTSMPGVRAVSYSTDF